MNTKVHSLALFLHPMCWKLAVMQVANDRSFEFMVKVELGVAKRWKWDIIIARKLSDDLQACNQSLTPFAGGQANGLSRWKNLPINCEIHPLKAVSVTIISIVRHAGEVERTFSDFGTTQSTRPRQNSAVKTAEAGKSTRRRMHTREEVGTAVETAQDLEASFTWALPLSTKSRDADDLLAGPESISPDDIAAEFAGLEELKRTEEVQSIT
ncbi:hypothetical protein F4604DRAFT_1958802 [Suillus subluteus]|nr:hypothetical protein F4604DRAFT_1936216 [Suillus subluteus]KAG1854497.1 hypothetical protein F4604DRAFT_1958802 [Suillus subluteus]